MQIFNWPNKTKLFLSACAGHSLRELIQCWVSILKASPCVWFHRSFSQSKPKLLLFHAARCFALAQPEEISWVQTGQSLWDWFSPRELIQRNARCHGTTSCHTVSGSCIDLLLTSKLGVLVFGCCSFAVVLCTLR